MRFIRYLLATATIATLALALLGIENTTSVPHNSQISTSDIIRIKSLIKKSDPRRLKSGQSAHVSLTQRDIDLMLHYLLAKYPTTNASITLNNQSLTIQLSEQLPDNPMGRYINVSATLRQTGYDLSLLRLTSLSIGKIPIPTWAAEPIIKLAHHRALKNDHYETLYSSITGVTLSAKQVSIDYQWANQLAGIIRSYTLPGSEEAKKRFAAYAEQIAWLSKRYRYRRISLARVFNSLLLTARDRTLSGHNAVEENKAMLIVLGTYVSGQNVAKFMDQMQQKKLRVYPMYPLLNHRRDLMQHFVISAAVTATSGTGLANFIAEFKEISDSLGGSGFSFADLAADKAGIAFCRYALSPATATKLHNFTQFNGLQEQDLMISTHNLKEGLQQEQFEKLYTNTKSPAYRKTSRAIDRQLRELPLFQ